MKAPLFFSTITLALMTVQSWASVTVYAEYHLGESGSLGANNLPLDSSGNGRNFVNEISGVSASVGSASFHPNASGSTAYLDTSGAGNEGWYSSGLFSGLQTDNFALGVFARSSSNAAANQGDIFTVGGSNGSIKLSLAGNGWAASAHNVAWIGQDSGVSGSFTADAWVHLALVRAGGTTTFYINGTPVSGTYAGVPVNDTPHLSVAPGGSSYFDGLMDEARVVTFTAGEPTSNIINALQGVPEPSAALLAVLGLAVGLKRRRE
jgi:hypothetical protein